MAKSSLYKPALLDTQREPARLVEQKPTSRGSKINNIQALRAFAAIAVVLFHTGYMWPTSHAVGSFGVDVFFVISGYIMARICDLNSSYFLRRRLIRIVPPYWVLTVLLFAASMIKPTLFASTRAHWGELLKSLFFIPFIKESGLYRPILFVGWSLNFEMFFYLAISAALLMSRRWAIVLASALVISVQLLCHAFGRSTPVLGFYADPAMLEFPWGVLAYFVTKNIPQPAAVRFRTVSSLLAAGALLYLVLGQAFAVSWPVLDWSRVGITSFVLVCSAALMSKGEWDTRVASVVLIGDASYILYLLHPYCIYFIGRIVASHFALLNITQLPGSLFAGAIAIAISVWAHLKLELPTVNYLNARFGGHRRTTEFKQTA